MVFNASVPLDKGTKQGDYCLDAALCEPQSTHTATALPLHFYVANLCIHIRTQALKHHSNSVFTPTCRFTPPTHSILAFHAAIQEFLAEGGVAARSARYKANQALLREGMAKMGFKEYLASEHQGYIITSFQCVCLLGSAAVLCVKHRPIRGMVACWQLMWARWLMCTECMLSLLCTATSVI